VVRRSLGTAAQEKGMTPPKLSIPPKEVHDPGGLRYGDGFISFEKPPAPTRKKPGRKK
jgi:hypothetical protein